MAYQPTHILQQQLPPPLLFGGMDMATSISSSISSRHDHVFLFSSAVAVAGGLMLALLYFILECVWFFFLRALEANCLLQRLSPSIPPTRLHPTKEGFISASLTFMPLVAIAFAGREKCYFSVDMMVGLPLCWVVMVMHDAFFWLMHTCMHDLITKGAYKWLHQPHHSTGGDISVFSAGYGNILDIPIHFVPFYTVVMLIYCSGQWNAFHVCLILWVVTNVNLLGHCGYWLPMWLFGLVSLGMVLTPFAQQPLHHHIHHLDARFNRSLYFTWWDRLAGTFRETHPKIPESFG